MDAIDLMVRGVMDVAGIKAGMQSIITDFMGLNGKVSSLSGAFTSLGGAATAAFAVIGAGLVAVGAGMAKAVQDAAAWESALVRVSKTTGIEKGTAAYAALSNELQAMRMLTGVTAEAAAAGAESAGSVGIGQEYADLATRLEQAGKIKEAKEAWSDYAKTIAESTTIGQKMAGAFNMSAEETMTAMGQLGATTKQTGQTWQDFMTREGSVIDALGNSLATSEARIISGMEHASSAFALYKPTDEVLYKWTALMGVMQSSGFVNAGEGIKDLMNYLMRPELSNALSKMMGISPEAFQQAMQKDAPEVISQVAALYKNLNATQKAEIDKLSGDTGRKVWQYLQSDDVRKMYERAKETALEAGREGTGLDKSYEASLQSYEQQTARFGQIVQTTFEKIGQASLEPMTQSIKDMNAALEKAQPTIVSVGSAITTFVTDIIAGSITGLANWIAALGEVSTALQKAASDIDSWGFSVRDQEGKLINTFSIGGLKEWLGLKGTDVDEAVADAISEAPSTQTDAQIMRVAQENGTNWSDYMKGSLETNLPTAVVDAYNIAGAQATDVAAAQGEASGTAWANGYKDRVKELIEKGYSKEFANWVGAYGGSDLEALQRYSAMQDQLKTPKAYEIGGSKYNWQIEGELPLSMHWTTKGGSQSKISLTVGDKTYSRTVPYGMTRKTYDELFADAARDLGEDVRESFTASQKALTEGLWDQGQYNNFITLNPNGIQFKFDDSQTADNLYSALKESVESAINSGELSELDLAGMKELQAKLAKTTADPGTTAIFQHILEDAKLISEDMILLTQTTNEKQREIIKTAIDQATSDMSEWMGRLNDVLNAESETVVVNATKNAEYLLSTLTAAFQKARDTLSETGTLPADEFGNMISNWRDLQKAGGSNAELDSAMSALNEAYRNAQRERVMLAQAGSDAERDIISRQLQESEAQISAGMDAINSLIGAKLNDIVVDAQKYGEYLKQTLADALAEAQESINKTGIVSNDWVNTQIEWLNQLKSTLPEQYGALGGDMAIQMLEGFKSGSVSWSELISYFRNIGVEMGNAAGEGFTTALGASISPERVNAQKLLTDPSFWSKSATERQELIKQYVGDVQTWFGNLVKSEATYNQGLIDQGLKASTDSWNRLKTIWSENASWFTREQATWMRGMQDYITAVGGASRVSNDVWDAFWNAMSGSSEKLSKATDQATKTASQGYDNLKKTISDCTDCVLSDFAQWQEAQEGLFQGSYIGQGGDQYLAWKESQIAAIRETQQAMKQVGGAVLGKDYTGSEYDWADANKRTLQVTADTSSADSALQNTMKSLDDLVSNANKGAELNLDTTAAMGNLNALLDSIAANSYQVMYVETIHYDTYAGGSYMPSTSPSSYGGGYEFKGVNANDVFGAYDEGTDYVPRTGKYILHEGEAVLTREENSHGRRSIVYSPSHTFILGSNEGVTEERVRALLEEDRKAFKREILEGTL